MDMSESRRELFLRVVDGDMRLPPYLFNWAQRPACDVVCKWLIKHNMTGKVLHDWMRANFKNSMDLPFKWVFSKVQRDPELAKRPTLLERDYIPFTGFNKRVKL